MISIITRAYNRLEYTIQVINNVRMTADVEYEHIIIDNNSSDGTNEWFSWVSKNMNWYRNLKYVKLPYNAGDWGGMVEGYSHASGQHIVQLDNDILPCDKWLSAMVYVLENTKYEIVMLHRANVEWKLKPKSIVETLKNGLEVCTVERPVACYMMRTTLFNKAALSIRKSDTSKYQLSRMVKGRVAKIINRDCIEIEAPYQRTKYNPKNKNVWAKL